MALALCATLPEKSPIAMARSDCDNWPALAPMAIALNP
jgi:hypothetical protein